jgi:hypothetical protein
MFYCNGLLRLGLNHRDKRGFIVMAQLVIPNAALITLNWSGETRTWKNVIGAVGTGALPVIDQTLANNLFTGISTAAGFVNLLALLANTVVFESLTIRDIHAPNLPEFTSAGTPVSGGGTDDCLPLNVAAVVTIRTALAGKSFRGRNYFSGFSEAQNDATGRQLPAVNTAIVGAMTSINSILAGHSMTVAVLSRPSDAVTIPAKTTPARVGQGTAVSAFVARNTKWESQRRRTGRD